MEIHILYDLFLTVFESFSGLPTSFRPSDMNTMTDTALEATALPHGDKSEE